MVFTCPGTSLNEGRIGNRTVQNRFELDTAASKTKRAARESLPDRFTT
jgi:hypothetical protein